MSLGPSGSDLLDHNEQERISHGMDDEKANQTRLLLDEAEQGVTVQESTYYSDRLVP